MNRTLLALLLAVAGNVVASSLFLNLAVFTNLPGTVGNLDFQFNPGNGTSPAATATVTLFNPVATLNGPSSTGGVSGDLTSALAIANTTSFNDYFVGYTFPAQIDFLIAFSGSAVDSPTGTGFGSTFFFSLYDAAGANPLQTTNADGSGSLFSVDLLNTGSIVVNDYTVGGASISAVQTPEPGSVGLVLVGLAEICRQRFLKNSRENLRRIIH